MAIGQRGTKMRPSRREFVKWVTVSGISLGVSRLGLAAVPEFSARETLPGRQGWNPAAHGKGRIDGIAKVTGAKLYASDFRAADMPGWPAETSHALLIRTPDASHILTGIDLTHLSPAAKPSVIVTAEDLARAGTRVPDFYTGDLFCPVGKTPLYLGQPVALLIFATFDAYDRARLELQAKSGLMFGPRTGPFAKPNYTALRFTRVAGPTPDSPDVYAPIDAGWISPKFFDNGGRPIWQPMPIKENAAYAKGATYGDQILAHSWPHRIPISWCWTANLKPSPSIRFFLSRNAAWPGTTRTARALSWCSASSRQPMPPRAWPISSVRPRRPTSRRKFTHSSPMSADPSVAAITRRFRSTWHWPRCSFPDARSGWRMTAFSNFRAVSSAIGSICAAGSASIARAER